MVERRMCLPDAGLRRNDGGGRCVAAAVATAALCIAAVAVGTPACAADTFPSRPVRIVIPSTPGGALDVLGRILSQPLTEKWGVQVVVDDHGGAGGVIGTEIVAKAPPDGHTLLFVTMGYTTNPFLLSKLPYRTPEDFAPITVIGYTPVALVVHPSLPVKSVKELIALAKAQPGKLAFGSSGTGSGGHLAAVLLQNVAGIKLIHVPYKGAGAVTAAVVQGEVQMVFTAPGSVLAQVKAGRLHMLATTGSRRVSAMPEVPTVGEIGLPGLTIDGWYGALAPAGTPKPVIDRIYGDMLASMKTPEITAKLQAAGFEVGGMEPAAFGRYLANERKKWSAVISEAGIKEQ